MNELLFHPRDYERLQSFLQMPGHALLLVGPTGSGKGTVSHRIGENILGLNSGNLSNYPYKLLIGQNREKAVGIDEVRDLEHFLSLKVPRSGVINRLVVIEDAQKLGHEAQNALLKTLEEPPEDTLLILTTTFEQALLPTIRSRVQSIQLQLPTAEQVDQYYKEKGYSSQKIARAYAMSGGLPGLMTALLSNTEHPMLSAAELAKNALRANTYERMLMVDELSRQQSLTDAMLTILQQMARISLQSAAGSAAIRWKTVLEAVYEARESLQKNGQAKLVVTRLMLRL